MNQRIIIKGAISITDEDGLTHFLTNYNPDGYPILAFDSSEEMKKWVDRRMKEVSEQPKIAY